MEKYNHMWYQRKNKRLYLYILLKIIQISKNVSLLIYKIPMENFELIISIDLLVKSLNMLVNSIGEFLYV